MCVVNALCIAVDALVPGAVLPCFHLLSPTLTFPPLSTHSPLYSPNPAHFLVRLSLILGDRIIGRITRSDLMTSFTGVRRIY